MALCYLDTSALAKLYVEESGTERMLELVRREEGHTLALLALSRIEMHSAVRRRQRSGDISQSAAGELLSRFERHLDGRYLVQPIVQRVLDGAVGLLERHDLRAYDALQLSGCQALNATSPGQDLLFVCSDEALVQAARREGLATFDPRP